MMKEMFKEDQPYEKCMKYGAISLSNAELLAVLLRTGTKGKSALDVAQILLGNQYEEGGLLNIHALTFEKLKDIRGIGPVKAVQILCLSELAKRLAKANAKERLLLNSPASIAQYYMEEMRHQKQEHIKLLMFNTKSMLLGESDISKGTVNAAIITPREIFIEALNKRAVSIVLLHNHPSGDPTPGENDFYLTKRIQDAGKIIGIELLDHIIIGNNCYISFLEENFYSN